MEGVLTIYLMQSVKSFDPCQLSVVKCETENPRQYVVDEFDKAGLDGDKMAKIVECESHFNVNAVNYNRNGTKDLGLYQINSVHQVSDKCRKDLICSTKWAINKVKKDKSFKAWVCEKLITD